jgi:superfamily II DNA/RNA helicase
VLDEADHMSELGFLEPMQRILRLVDPDAQKLLFSATLDREVAASSMSSSSTRPSTRWPAKTRTPARSTTACS